MPHDYLLCGLIVRSDFALPELVPAPPGSTAAPDVTITAGSLPDRLAEDDGPARMLTVAPDGTVLLTMPERVRLMVRDGRSIVADIDPANDGDWRLMLLGPALGLLMHQRGLFPLHAASLRIGDTTIAIAGISGAGKSTLTHGLMRRGATLLSDDLTVVDTQSDTIAVTPAFPRLKLWRDAVEAAGDTAEGLPRIREGLDKFDLQPAHAFDPAPSPLSAIVLLEWSESAVSLNRLAPTVAVPALIEQVARLPTAIRMGRKPMLMRQAGALAGRVPVHRLERPRAFDRFDEAAAAVMALAGR